MELFKTFQLLIIHLIASTVVLINGQISTPCTLSMITSFTPCLNYVTGSSNNGTSPTTSCCGSFKSIMSTSMDCACLLIAANVPVQLPINRALSLPKACNMSGVPIQCKSSGTPLPAPGPVLLGPSPPTIAPSLSPRASKVLARAPAPQSETTDKKLTPVASPPIDDGSTVPTKTAGIRPVLNPPASSSTTLSSVLLSFLLQSYVVALVFKAYQ